MQVDSSSIKLPMRSLRKILTRRSLAGSILELEDGDFQLVELCCAGGDISKTNSNLQAYLLHLKHLVAGRWTDEWQALIHDSYELPVNPVQKLVQLCSEVIEVLREYGGISLVRIIQRLQTKNVMRKDQGLLESAFAHQAVFNLIGWLSLLYIPAAPGRTNSLRVVFQGTGIGLRSTVAPELVNRPLDELFRSFGELLPRAIMMPGMPDLETAEPSNSIKFEVSHLNVDTMKTMAAMQIIWTDSLSGHLKFDPTKPSISIFKCPSYCRISLSEQASLTILLRQFYDDNDTINGDLKIAGFMKEILLSYNLLFKIDRRSRKQYQGIERIRASLGSGADRVQVDPCLDEVCGYTINTSFFHFGAPVRDQYDSVSDFPVLKDRLEAIQNYMKEIQPNRIVALWRDRRDLRLWYTIWVVIIIGVLSLILTTVSMFLAAAQVNYARLSYILQQKSNGGNQASNLALSSSSI